MTSFLLINNRLLNFDCIFSIQIITEQSDIGSDDDCSDRENEQEIQKDTGRIVVRTKPCSTDNSLSINYYSCRKPLKEVKEEFQKIVSQVTKIEK